jgi:hypothetical protein
VPATAALPKTPSKEAAAIAERTTALPKTPSKEAAASAERTTASAVPLPTDPPAKCEHGCGHIVVGHMQQIHDLARGVNGACVGPAQLLAASQRAAHAALEAKGFASLTALETHMHSGGRPGDFKISEALFVDPEQMPPWCADGAVPRSAARSLQRINQVRRAVDALARSSSLIALAQLSLCTRTRSRSTHSCSPLAHTLSPLLSLALLLWLALLLSLSPSLSLQRTGRAEWNTRLGLSADAIGGGDSIQMYVRGEVIADAGILVRLSPRVGETLYEPARPTSTDVRLDVDFYTQLLGIPLRCTVRASRYPPKGSRPAGIGYVIVALAIHGGAADSGADSGAGSAGGRSPPVEAP